LLICYPSQLVGNNTRNGIIASIPYRLRDYKQVRLYYKQTGILLQLLKLHLI